MMISSGTNNSFPIFHFAFVFVELCAFGLFALAASKQVVPSSEYINLR